MLPSMTDTIRAVVQEILVAGHCQIILLTLVIVQIAGVLVQIIAVLPSTILQTVAVPLRDRILPTGTHFIVSDFMLLAGVSIAFDALSEDYRLGYYSINGRRS